MDVADPGAYKQAIASIFTRTSATHDTVGTPLFGHFGSSLVEYVELQRGHRVLDVAAGTGATLFPAARRIAGEGRVIGVDLAPGMVQRLRAEIASRETTNAGMGVADAEDLPFADESFDTVLCGFALFFFPHTGRALGEFWRVLRPGGQLGVSTFAREGQASFERIRRLVFAHVGDPPAPEDKVEFDQPRQLHEALRAARFVGVEVEIFPLELVLPDLDAFLAWLSSMEFRDDLERMDAETLAAFRRSAAADLAPTEGVQEVRLRMDALLTRARKPTDAGHPNPPIG